MVIASFFAFVVVVAAAAAAVGFVAVEKVCSSCLHLTLVSWHMVVGKL